jgi:hypothetical protein
MAAQPEPAPAPAGALPPAIRPKRKATRYALENAITKARSQRPAASALQPAHAAACPALGAPAWISGAVLAARPAPRLPCRRPKLRFAAVSQRR